VEVLASVIRDEPPVVLEEELDSRVGSLGAEKGEQVAAAIAADDDLTGDHECSKGGKNSSQKASHAASSVSQGEEDSPSGSIM